MFDLNEKISMWRSNLAQSETLAGSDIDELESHLREEIENLTGLKLSDEEAFLIATHRLGGTDSLAKEYEKINRSMKFRRRLSLMIAGILAYLMATYFAISVSRGCVWLVATGGIRGYTLGIIGFISQILTLVATFFFGYCICKRVLHRPGFRKQINKLTTRLIFLTSLLVFLITTVVYRAAFKIPVPGFLPINIQQHVVAALTYTKFLWSILLPIILMMVLINLREPNSHRVKSR